MDMKLFSHHHGFGGAICALSLAVLSFAGCGPKEEPIPPKPARIEVSGVSLDQTSLTLTVGGTASLAATVSPADATDKTVTWSSSNESVATVKNGTVTAVAVGSATITAKAGSKSATCSVTVSAKEVPVTGITLEPTSVTIEVGQTAKLSATVSPADATNATVTWSSSDESVATVSNGTVTAVAVGSTTITATAGGKSATCSVTAKEIPVTGITLEPTSVTIEAGQTAQLSATVSPADATDKTVTWSSSNESVATVDNGTVTAVAEGTATVTATAGGKSATCAVTVQPSQESKIKSALMMLYDAMDGPHWKMDRERWSLSTPLAQWSYVEWNETTGQLVLWLSVTTTGEPIGLKGEFPDCFDEWPWLSGIYIGNEPSLIGTFPSSFSKLKGLKDLSVLHSSMTRLEDVFNGIPLERVCFASNDRLTGPLPESLASSPSLTKLEIEGNHFTGTVPDSWATLGTRLSIRNEPDLDARVPASFVTAKDADYLINQYLATSDYRTTPNEVGDYDIPAYVPRKELKDLVTGKAIPIKQVFGQNKVTILLNWATWCPFSKELMPVLKRMYEKYHKDGLEIVAAYNSSDADSDDGRPLQDVLKERGYDQWYNFNIWDLSIPEWEIWADGTPSAILVDSKGNILASSRPNVSDPVRNRYGYGASSNLIPLLESIFGPLEGDGDYSSTDYSQDGKVLTIQTATTGKGINLVFMGDAYTDKDVASGLYERMMRACVDEFFSLEPYRSFRDRFNVYAVTVVSKNGKTGAGYTTTLGATMAGGSAITGNADKVYEYALKVPGISSKENLTVGVLVNSIYHGGIADLNETNPSGIGYYSSMGNDPLTFGPTLRHETAGHAFTFLADEYATQSGSPSQEVINEYNRLYKANGWYSNIDFTSDPKKVKWADFLSDARYKDEVGVYEGALNVTKGAYRPSVNSMMNQNMEYFNAPSRWAIYQRIMKLSGESCSFDKFLQYDAVNRGAKQAHAPLTRPGNGWVPGSAPVITR